MRLFVLVSWLGLANARYASDATPTAAEVEKFWHQSHSFQGWQYSAESNPCSYAGLKEEEPWATICPQPHTLCNDDSNKWNVHIEAWMGVAPDDPPHWVGFSQMFASAMNSSIGHGWDNKGLISNPLPHITVTLPDGVEADIYYLCHNYYKRKLTYRTRL